MRSVASREPDASLRTLATSLRDVKARAVKSEYQCIAEVGLDLNLPARDWLVAPVARLPLPLPYQVFLQEIAGSRPRRIFFLMTSNGSLVILRRNEALGCSTAPPTSCAAGVYQR